MTALPPLPQWRLDLPWRYPPITPNDRFHWAARARITAEIKQAGWALAKAAQIPACERISVRMHWQPSVVRRRDGDSVSLTVKGLVDGITAAGVVPDDTTEYVTHLPLVVEPIVKGDARMWLVVVDESQVAA